MQLEVPNPEPQQDLLHFAFFNDRELRPGWRILIAVALYCVTSYAISLLLRPLLVRLPRGFEPATLIVSEALAFAGILLVSWIMSRIEHRSLGEYGLPLRNSRFLHRFIVGCIFWGFLPLTVLLLVLRSLHAFYFGNLVLHGSQIVYWAAVWGVFFCLVGLYEEYFLRGYLLYTLADGVGFWPAAVVLASMFAVLHTFNGGESRIGVLMTAFFAMFAAVMLRYTGNLWIAVGAHAGWDWGQSYFYGVSDSGLQLRGHLLNPGIQGPAWLNGGTAGPEGSILCLVLMVALAVLFAFMCRRANQRIG